MLSDPERFQFVNFVCVAMVSQVRDLIMEEDFSCVMINLQNSGERVESIEDLLNYANVLCQQHMMLEPNQLYRNEDDIKKYT